MLSFRIKIDSASSLQIKFLGIPGHELHGPFGSPRFPLRDAAIWRTYARAQLMQQCQIEGGQHPRIWHQTVSETKWLDRAHTPGDGERTRIKSGTQ
jgi:hypothetical protein